MNERRVVVRRDVEPHVPVGRLEDGTWVFAPPGAMLVVGGGELVVCHACGQALAAVSAGHLRPHGLTLARYRERFGLNRKMSLVAPALAAVRRVEGRRRWAANSGVREGLGVGQALARSGVLYGLGAGSQPRGSRRAQGRVAASRQGASPALAAHRAAQSAAALARWEVRAAELGYSGLEAYVTDRRGEGVSVSRVRRELGCGSGAAGRLLGFGGG